MRLESPLTYSPRGGRPCSACADPRRPELDASIVAGASFRAIARRFPPLCRDAIRRHRPHVAATIVRTEEARRDSEAASLWVQILALEENVQRLRQKAEDVGDLRAALAAIGVHLDVIRLMNEIGARADKQRGLRFEFKLPTCKCVKQASGGQEQAPTPPVRRLPIDGATEAEPESRGS
ncbi:MAG TPA: hypothetical protein PLB02_04110 [Thermoanaerobaculia bacterium]|nr:hypothetical protein [Thermoanaerobaculia bacterium]HQR66556.1 hypothetical protein [Thermoanaerobaculia bacterium]